MKKVWILIFFLFIPFVAAGQAPTILSERVVINEIAWMGIPLDGVEERQWWRYEWIELYNPEEQAVSLQGWQIQLYSGEQVDFTIGLYGSVAANDYILIGASEKIPGVDINYATLAGKLKNPGQHVVLKDAVGNIAEEIDATGGWFAGDNDLKLTMERRFVDRPANDSENWGSSLNTGGSPKTQNTVFGKEKVLVLEKEKRDLQQSSFSAAATNTVLTRAVLLALVSAVGVLLLRRYVVRSSRQDEDSFDALKD